MNESKENDWHAFVYYASIERWTKSTQFNSETDFLLTVSFLHSFKYLQLISLQQIKDLIINTTHPFSIHMKERSLQSQLQFCKLEMILDYSDGYTYTAKSDSVFITKQLKKLTRPWPDADNGEPQSDLASETSNTVSHSISQKLNPGLCLVWNTVT